MTGEEVGARAGRIAIERRCHDEDLRVFLMPFTDGHGNRDLSLNLAESNTNIARELADAGRVDRKEHFAASFFLVRRG